ncbi:hypothetical protein FCM35_KLT18413 [Carex littledalei]|uniref:Vesicle transport protein n=1 Tax=Carex littledalei TaxID=544730 RepID=A0A833VGH2_9POAL|nr:hypothetical protein FCM35_KLT18413 [Carex littledalei]
MEQMNRALERAKMLVGMEVDEEAAVREESSSFIDDFNRQCTLSTTQQRLYGFAICFVSGITCVLLSMIVFFNPIKFGITFTFGNLLALGRCVMILAIIHLSYLEEIMSNDSMDDVNMALNA